MGPTCPAPPEEPVTLNAVAVKSMLPSGAVLYPSLSKLTVYVDALKSTERAFGTDTFYVNVCVRVKIDDVYACPLPNANGNT